MANTDKQVVFIDANVPDLRDLLSGLAPGVRAFVLDPHRNGLAQIARILATHELTDLSSISIVGHGSSGAIEVGGTTLDNDGLSSHAAALNKIGAALAPDGALQLYSCDVASGIAGQQFMADLSQYAGGVTVDASDRDIGLTAAGENWTLDATAGATGSAPVAPFTAQAESGFQGTLTLTANQIVFDATNEESGSIDDGTRVEQFGVSGSTEISGSSVDIADASKTGDSGLVFENSGIAVDSALNEYFVAVDNPDTHILSIQKGALSGSSLNTFWTNPLPDINTTNFPPVVAVVGGLALDAGTGELYFAQAGISYSTGDPVAADTGIYKVSINGGTPTLLNSTSNTLFEPTYLALDVSANLLFFTDAFDSAESEGLIPSVNNLDVMNLSTGSITVLHSFTQQNNDDPNFLLQGLAVDSVNDVVYLATANLADSTSADNAILSIPFSVSGSGTSASASIGTISTLYSGAGADQPSDIVIDPAHDIFYTTGEEPTTGGFYGAVFEGSLSGGSSLTKVVSMDSVLPRGNGAAVDPAALDDQLPQLVLLTQPTVTASGTVTADSGGSAVTVDSGVTVSDQDGQNLAEATVSGALTSDTLSFNGGATKTFSDGATISSSFSGGTLTLSGDASPADYQTALDAVTFGTTSTSATPRTIDWTVSDGVVTSPTTTSTVDVQVPPVVTAGGTVTFDGGGSPVVLDSGLVVTDASSSTLSSATVRITGYISGDTLTVGTPGGLGTSFSNGALTLTGTASLATYQTALESISYSVSPSNSDPTGGGSHSTRTIDWTVNDGVLNSGTATSTLDTVHVKPTIVAGATATFDGGGSAVTLDSGVTESDVDSGGVLASATISIGTGYISGDTLNFTNTNSTTEGNISVASDSGGVLKLTSSGPTATLAQWQTALESVTYSFSPSNGDPTGGGSDTSRTIDWVVNDGSSSNGISSTATSTLDTVHVKPTITAGATATFDGGGSPVTLDSGVAVSDVDSGGVLSSATVTVVGAITGDTLNFTNTNSTTEGNISVASDSGGVLKLTSSGETATVAQWQTALESITYSYSPSNGDPTGGGSDTSRTIDWVVNDGSSSNGLSSTATSTLDTVHVAPTIAASGNVDFGFGGSPVILDSTADVTDVDSGGNLSSATVSIGTGYISGEDTLSFTSEDGITGAFSSGLLSLSGTASLADYDAVLQSVTFDTTSTTTGSRTIDWSVNDGVLGSSIATSTVDVAPCYCRGTLIKTKCGQKRVENLKIGDKVITASGEQRPIRWVGRRSYSGRFVMGRKDILPVCIKAGALDDNVPKRDLWISPNHAMFLDGVLIEAKDLINCVSIVQADSIEQVEYFHIELESHDVIIAEGALSESFIDDDSRGMFHNAHEYRTLYPDAAIGLAQYCAPRVEDGYEVEAVRQRIAARAGLAANSEGTRIGDLRGYVDRITSECVAGWAQNVEHPQAPVCLDVFAGGLLVGQVLANRYREDLERAGMGGGCHSFEFTLPSGLAFAPDEVEVRRSFDGVALDLTIEAWRMLRQNASRGAARRAVA
jgi:hypothetical protein